MDIIRKLREEFGITQSQAENTVRLLDEGNTVPFIARYRKEMTGSLDDQIIRQLSERLTALRNLEDRRTQVRTAIAEQGRLTDALAAKLDAAQTQTEIEDIYRPFRPKRRTRASIAKEKGLQPLADIIWGQKLIGTPEEAAKERAGAVRRSGLLLDDEAVLHAMEHSDTPQYLPLSSLRREDTLASAEQLGLLARHIETTLLELAHELRDGSITADPYFRSGQDTACTHCDYLSVCHFTPGVEGDCHRVLTKLPADKIWSSLKGGEMHG